MKRKLVLYFVFLIIGFIVPHSVFAEGEVAVQIKTSIENWSVENNLVFYHGEINPSNGSSFQTADYRVYLESSTDSSNRVYLSLSDLDTINCAAFAPGSTVYLVEEFVFLANDTTSLGDNVFSVTLGGFLPGDISVYSEEIANYMFESYSPRSNVDIHVLVLNNVDGDGNLLGGRAISSAYIDVNGFKEAEISQGQISLPTYCVNFSFDVRGTAAIEGMFSFQEDVERLFSIGANPRESASHNSYTVSSSRDDFVNLDFLYSLYNEDYPYGFSYSDVNNMNDYEITLQSTQNNYGSSFYESLEISDNEYCLSYRVTARKDFDANTGLIYNLVPFLVTIGIVLLGVFGFLFFKKKKRKLSVKLPE